MKGAGPRTPYARDMAVDLPAAFEHGASPQYRIESVDNALRVILLLREQQQLRLTEVSHYLGVASSTAHRLLSMLAYRGFVRQEPGTKSYVPGPSLDHLAIALLRRLDVRERARPVLERLNTELDETIHLGRLEGRDVHFIDSLESSRALRVGGRLGRSVPAHCTSNGKAMLAALSEQELLAVYPDEELEQMTPRSIATRTALVGELDTVRRRGYATSEGESEEGVASIGVALSTISPRHAVNASAPLLRLDKATRKRILERVRQAVQEIDQVVI
jgi:DNA-binding IclR family transcriptional regulator